MTAPRPVADAVVVPVLAALATFATLLGWAGFSERPSGYLVPLFWICVVVAGVGCALRALRLPALVVLLGQLLLLLVWACRVWAGAWLPTPTTLSALADTWRLAVETANMYAAPVSADVVELHPLLIVGGAGCAVAVDFLAAGLRRVPLAGLPLLAAYTAPVSLLAGGVSWFVFSLGALAFLALLAADELLRLGRWGSNIAGAGRLEDSQRRRVTGQAVWPAAQRIGVTATGLAVVAPLLVPTLSLGFVDGFGPGAGGDGDGVAIRNPMLDMKRNLTRGEDEPLIAVSTSDPDPGYLRLTVLDDYRDDAWRPSKRQIPPTQRAIGEMPAPAGLSTDVRTTQTQYDVSVADDFDSTWLPVSYPATSVEAATDWRYDLRTMDFISALDGQDAAGRRYDFTQLNVFPTTDQLINAPPAPSQITTEGTERSDGLPRSVVDLAAEVTEGSLSEFQAAVMLQDWFREDGGFVYSLRPDQGTGVEQLERFLGTGRGSRTGYCEQFAAAMALMARATGIPARVAVGFLRPQKVSDDLWVYSAHDMHAWPELYFEGVGWIRFEPTPQVQAGSVPSYTTADLPSPVQPSLPTASASLPDDLRPGRPTPTTQTSAVPSSTDGSGPGPGWAVAGAVVAAVTLAGAPRALRAAVRRRRTAGTGARARLEGAWAEIRATARDLGLPWDDRLTLRVQARGLAARFGRRPGPDDDAAASMRGRGPHADPEATRALERLVLWLERARYASRGPDEAELTDLAAAVERVTAAMRAGVRASTRRRATWLPASLWSGRAIRLRRPRAAVGEPGLDQSW
jgi:transglutaminase-like putative cysteine protease